jgi:hypothetical protein
MRVVKQLDYGIGDTFVSSVLSAPGGMRALLRSGDLPHKMESKR